MGHNKPLQMSSDLLLERDRLADTASTRLGQMSAPIRPRQFEGDISASLNSEQSYRYIIRSHQETMIHLIIQTLRNYYLVVRTVHGNFFFDHIMLNQVRELKACMLKYSLRAIPTHEYAPCFRQPSRLSCWLLRARLKHGLALLQPPHLYRTCDGGGS